MAVGVWKAVLRQWLQVYKTPEWLTVLVFWGCRGVQSVSLIYPSFKGEDVLQCSLEAFHMESRWWNTTEDPDHNVKYLAKRFFVGCVISGGCTPNSLVFNWFLQIVLVGRIVWNGDWLISVSLRVFYKNSQSFQLFPWSIHCNVLGGKFAHPYECFFSLASRYILLGMVYILCKQSCHWRLSYHQRPDFQVVWLGFVTSVPGSGAASTHAHLAPSSFGNLIQKLAVVEEKAHETTENKHECLKQLYF